jgi:threonine dehydrogenase-like Zn-dependent dehydrogenase
MPVPERMHALTVEGGRASSAALSEVEVPKCGAGMALVRTLAVGICGTDAEILAGEYGSPPPGEKRLIIGHESVGVVEHADSRSGLSPGELVVGIVRRPDPVPCSSCAAQEWDMCRNGLYTECGIKERHGFCAEYFVSESDFLVPVEPSLGILAVLLEPTSVVAKAWEHIERIGSRAHWEPHRVLVTGAGPVGLLAAMLGQQRGLEVHVLDRIETGPKPALVRALGASYHATSAPLNVLNEVMPDIVLECTGVPEVVLGVLGSNARSAIVCLVGVSGTGRTVPVDVGALNRSMVLENDVVFGTVNANRRHYELAARALAAADRAWLAALITRRVPLARWHDALQKQADDVKVIIETGAE